MTFSPTALPACTVLVVVLVDSDYFYFYFYYFHWKPTFKSWLLMKIVKSKFRLFTNSIAIFRRVFLLWPCRQTLMLPGLRLNDRRRTTRVSRCFLVLAVGLIDTVTIITHYEVIRWPSVLLATSGSYFFLFN